MAVVMVSDAAGYPVRHEYRMRLYGCLLWYRGKDWAEQNVRDDQAEGYHAEWDTVIRYAATAPGALFSCKPGTNNLAPDCISPMIKRTYLSAGSASAACRSCAGTSLSLRSLRQCVQLHQTTNSAAAFCIGRPSSCVRTRARGCVRVCVHAASFARTWAYKSAHTCAREHKR